MAGADQHTPAEAGSWRLEQPSAHEDIEVWRKYLRDLRSPTSGRNPFPHHHDIEVAEFVVAEKEAGRMASMEMTEEERRTARQLGSCMLICGDPGPFASLADWQEFLDSMKDWHEYDPAVIHSKIEAHKMIAAKSMRGERE